MPHRYALVSLCPGELERPSIHRGTACEGEPDFARKELGAWPDCQRGKRGQHRLPLQYPQLLHDAVELIAQPTDFDVQR